MRRHRRPRVERLGSREAPSLYWAMIVAAPAPALTAPIHLEPAPHGWADERIAVDYDALAHRPAYFTPTDDDEPEALANPSEWPSVFAPVNYAEYRAVKYLRAIEQWASA